MRLGIVAATMAVLTGVAVAQAVERPAAESSTVAGHPTGRATLVVNPLLDDLAPPAGHWENSRQQIGTVLSTNQVLRDQPGDGTAKRTTTLRYPGVSYVKVHLDRATLGERGAVTVSNPTRSEVHRYDQKSLDAGRWAMSITGDTAVVSVDGGGVVIDQVARGFTRGERAEQTRRERERATRARRQESVCGSDDKSNAVCYRNSDPGLYQRSKAVVRLLINNSELCTGWRVGSKNRFITNNHCFTDTKSAYNTEVWFNYQCTQCGGGEVFQPTKVWGDQVLTTDRPLDLTVFTVTEFAKVEKFGYLDLELKQPVVGEELFIPQHPAGEPTVIAARSDEDRSGTCTVADAAYDGYARDSDVAYYCDTEGGSSGSPVLSRRTGRVIALHHFGGCPNSGVRSDLVYQRIRNFL